MDGIVGYQGKRAVNTGRSWQRLKPGETYKHPARGAAIYSRRRPEQTLLYRTLARHSEIWLALASTGQFDGQGDHIPQQK